VARPSIEARAEDRVITSHVTASHVIRRVLLRQLAIVNYVNPF